MNGKNDPLVEFEVVGRITVGTIRTSSVLSALNVAEFGNTVLDYIQEHPGLNLLLNFENVDYLSSAVLTELLRINKAINESNGRLHLCAISTVIREVFEITNLDRIFVIYEEGKTAGIKRLERSLNIAAQEAAWKNSK